MKFYLTVFLIVLIGSSYYLLNTQYYLLTELMVNFLSNNFLFFEIIFNNFQELKNSTNPISIGFFSLLLSTSLVFESLEAYIYLLQSLGVDFFMIILIIPIFATIGSYINYLVGYSLGDKIINYLFGNISGFKEDILEHASWLLIFLTALLPIPDFAVIILGTHKTNQLKFLIITFFGKLFRISLIATGSTFFLPSF